MDIGEMRIGVFVIGPSYANEHDKIGIFNHETGEGSDFDRDEFEKVVMKFYRENF